jgi:two-component system, OmpR family, phosphate regulon sensor histidine kinase PhoR
MVLRPRPRVDTDNKLPLAARLLILTVVGVGGAGVLLRMPDVPLWSGRDILTWFFIAGGVALAEQFPIPLRHRSETLNFSMTEAVWVGGLILARASVLTLAVATGLLCGQFLRRWTTYKVAFNVGQFLVALTVAQAVYRLMEPQATLQPRAWLSAAVAMGAYAVVNASLVALVIALAEEKRFLDVLLPPIRVNLIHFAANTAIGLEAAVIWSASPFALPMLVLPLLFAHFGYETLVRSLREGDRIRHLILENASDGIFAESMDGRILSWNPAMQRLTGYSSAEAVGRRRDEILLSPHADLAGEPPSKVGSVPSDGGTPVVPLLRKDGSTAWVRYSANTVATRDGKPNLTVAVLHDVTAAREAEELKSDFVATISHELRTPLTPLKGFLSTLLQGAVEDSQEARQEYYEIMLKQTIRLERLITDLLEVSRVEADRPLIENETVKLTTLVGEQVRAFQDQYPNRTIRLEVPDRGLLVYADHSALGLVVSNLISNAVKYSQPDAPVDVTLQAEGNEVIVSVRDQGEGIPFSEQERVFDRFYQVGSVHTRKMGGVGLGLYIARRLVEAMSGRLWVESHPGMGSTFFFTLPLVAAVSGNTVRLAEPAFTSRAG